MGESTALAVIAAILAAGHFREEDLTPEIAKALIKEAAILLAAAKQYNMLR